MEYIKAIANVLMDFQLTTGLDACIAFAGMCIVIAGILSLKAHPFRMPKQKVNRFDPFDEGEQWSKYDQLWNDKIAPVLFAVGLIAMGTATLWFAAVAPNFDSNTQQNDTVYAGSSSKAAMPTLPHHRF